MIKFTLLCNPEIDRLESKCAVIYYMAGLYITIEYVNLIFRQSDCRRPSVVQYCNLFTKGTKDLAFRSHYCEKKDKAGSPCSPQLMIGMI